MTDAFGEGVMVERALELAHPPSDLQNFIDLAGVTCQLRTYQANVPWRDPRVPQPAVLKVIAPAETICGGIRIVDGRNSLHLLRQRRRATLIGIHQQYPRMAKANLVQGCIAMSGIVVEDSLRHLRAQTFGNRNSRVRAERVEHMH